MNRLRGTITAIESHGMMSLVDGMVGDQAFSAILLETPETARYLRIGADVTLLFKETEVSLVKNLQGEISMRNRFRVRVTGITLGQILSAVELECAGAPLTSVITTRAVQHMRLVRGDILEALVKVNEIALMEGHDD